MRHLSRCLAPDWALLCSQISVEPYCPKESENVKVTTLYRCTRKRFRAANCFNSYFVWLCGFLLHGFRVESCIALCYRVFQSCLALWSPRLGKRERAVLGASGAFVCLLRTRKFPSPLSLPLGSRIDCGLWLWHSLDFSVNFFPSCFFFSVEEIYTMWLWCPALNHEEVYIMWLWCPALNKEVVYIVWLWCPAQIPSISRTLLSSNSFVCEQLLNGCVLF